MRKLLLIVVCLPPFVLSLASANGSSVRVHGKIVYSSDRGPNVHTAEIYSIGADGSRRRNLTRNQRYDGDFAWSPTGNRIAFWAEGRGGIRGLYVMRADGSRQQLLTPSDMQVAQIFRTSNVVAGRAATRLLGLSRGGLRDLGRSRGWRRSEAPGVRVLGLSGLGSAREPDRLGRRRGDRARRRRQRRTPARNRRQHVVSSPTWSPDALALAFVLLGPERTKTPRPCIECLRRAVRRSLLLYRSYRSSFGPCVVSSGYEDCLHR